jgi:hypothetical protein
MAQVRVDSSQREDDPARHCGKAACVDSQHAEGEMKQAALIGAVAGILVSFILMGVAGFREIKETSLRRAEAYKLACESTGGKVAWNFKYWECLK